MKAFNKQTLMTAGLLAVLATQISFTPASNRGSADLAQEAAPSAPQRTRTGNAAATTVRVQPIPIANRTGIIHDAPARTTVTATVDKAKEMEPISVRICNDDYKIKFVAVEKDGQAAIRGYARRGTQDVLSATQLGNFEAFSHLQADQDTFVAFLTKNVEEKTHCKAIAVDESNDPARKNKDETDKADEEKERAEKIARGVRNCTLDAKGKALKGDAKDECNLDRIAKAADMEDDSSSDEEGRHSRHRRSSGAGALLESAMDGLAKSITTKLLSDKKDSEEDGKELMDNTIDALSSAGDCEQTKRRTVNGLQKKWSCEGTDAISAEKFETALNRVQNLKTGDSFEEHSEFLAAQYNGLDEQINKLSAQIQSSQNPYMSMTLGSQLDSLKRQKEMMKIGLTKQGDSQYIDYANLLKTGGVQQEEFSDFTANYQDLLAQINGTPAPARPGSPTQGPSLQSPAPGDAKPVRTRVAQEGLRNNGVSIAPPFRR